MDVLVFAARIKFRQEVPVHNWHYLQSPHDLTWIAIWNAGLYTQLSLSPESAGPP